MKPIKQAIILSAGFGTRLRPLTDTMPKVMIPFSGKPLLAFHIEQFKKFGVTDFFINLHYLPDVITNYFGDGGEFGVRITYAFEDPILGTAGGMKNFEEKLDEHFFLIYGDVFSQVDYKKMNDAFFSHSDNPIGMELIGSTDHPMDSDLVETDATQKFLKIHQKPHTELPATYSSMRGVYIFSNRILKYIPPKTYYEIDHALLPDVLTHNETFYGFTSTDFVKDVGTMERYIAAKTHLGLT